LHLSLSLSVTFPTHFLLTTQQQRVAEGSSYTVQCVAPADHDYCVCLRSMRPDIPDMTDVQLNSYYYEVGERSFMKEALAYKVMVVWHSM